MEPDDNDTGEMQVMREQRHHYKKTSGFSGMRGEAFEYKLCALLYLKVLNLGLPFTLASNISGLGSFDDIYFDFDTQDGRHNSVFMQLKNRKQKRAIITKEQLLAKKGDYSLRKYYDSFLEVKTYVETQIPNGKFENCLFILFTNADIEEQLKSKQDIENDVQSFLNIQGKVLKFNEEEHEFIYKGLEDLPEHREFLDHFRLYYKQACESKLEEEIKSEILKLIPGSNSDAEFAHLLYLQQVLKWWEDERGKFLSSKFNHIHLIEDTLMEMAKLTEGISTRKSQLDKLHLTFQDSALNELKSVIQSQKVLLIFSACRSTTFTAAKINQALNTEEYVFMKLEDLVLYSSNIHLWANRKLKFLVIEIQNSSKDLHDLYIKIAISLESRNSNLKVIFIFPRLGNMEQIHVIRDVFGTNLKEHSDICKLSDLMSEIQSSILDKTITFQGKEMILSKLVDTSDVHKLDDLDSDSLSLLLANEKPKVGISIENTIQFYVDRTLVLQDGTEWYPTQALESSDKLILVTAEPGMGKTTLLTHLAYQTKAQHQDVWVVLININSYTKMLHDFKHNGFQESDALSFLEHVAQVDTKYGSKLEKELFYHTYMFTGNMVVLLDGVDEVSPLYDEQVIQIVKFLCKTKIRNIWITSRQFLKENLEKELGIHSYAITPFNERDMKSFLAKFWRSKVENVPEKDIEQLADHILQLSRQHLNDDSRFMGIPLLILMLAEVFQDRLGQENFLKDFEINLLNLYDMYVGRKWNIYCLEKKAIDLTNVNSLEDNSILYKKFIENHKIASLIAVLHEDELRRLEVLHLLFELDKKGIERKGLITCFNGNIPKFEHRSIAEYFVAKWLSDDLEKNRSIIQECILLPKFNVVKYFLDHILAENYPLHMSIISNDENTFTKILEQETDINRRDNGGRTSLFLAVSYKCPEFIRYLLSRDADAGVADNIFGWSSLECACKMDQWEIMMEYPQVLECVDSRGSSALHIAARYGIVQMGEYLIKDSLAVDIRNKYNETPLVEAVTHGHFEFAILLILVGAGISIRNAKGETLFEIAKEKGYYDISNLLARRNDNTIRVCMKTSDLHIAAKSRNLESVRKLVEAGHAIDLVDDNGCTPLWWAAYLNDIPVLEYLLDNGSCINLSGENIESPINISVKENHSEVLNLLLKYNAKLDFDTELQLVATHPLECSLKGYDEIIKASSRLKTCYTLFIVVPVAYAILFIAKNIDYFFLFLGLAGVFTNFYGFFYDLVYNLIIYLKYNHPEWYQRIQIQNKYLVWCLEKLKMLAFIHYKYTNVMNILLSISAVSGLAFIIYLIWKSGHTEDSQHLIYCKPEDWVICSVTRYLITVLARILIMRLLHNAVKLTFNRWYNHHLRIQVKEAELTFLQYVKNWYIVQFVRNLVLIKTLVVLVLLGLIYIKGGHIKFSQLIFFDLDSDIRYCCWISSKDISEYATCISNL